MSSRLATRAGPSWRAVFLVLMGVAVGVVATQSGLASAGSGSVAPAAKTARWASCPSVAFYPVSGSDSYATAGTGRIGASARLYCGLSLPHGATITAARFHLFDNDNLYEVNDCAIVRIRLDPPDGTYQTLAGPLSSGVAFHGGYVTRGTTAIHHALVDDRLYAYLAQCAIGEHEDGLQIVGVSVRYTPA